MRITKLNLLNNVKLKIFYQNILFEMKNNL